MIDIDVGDRVAVLRVENERLLIENWQLRGALGYPVPADIRPGNFKCGFCEAREDAQKRETRTWQSDQGPRPFANPTGEAPPDV